MTKQKPDEQNEDPNKIVGIPSKELFVDMLVKDLTLRDAIGDLVDNSVDAANRMAALFNTDLSTFSIDISFDKKHFSICDNAGGIEEEIARKYAFKLGKPKDFSIGKHTIGQFGIGMKRAFFKLGEHIIVESIALNSDFKITISVKEWRERLNEKDWDFKFDKTPNIITHQLKDTKLKIDVTLLKEDVKNQFNDAQFLIDLQNEISLEHLFAINKGLRIYINSDKSLKTINKPLEAPSITLISDRDFKPCYWSHLFPNGLKVEILTGISEDKGDEGGWYIFCNERLILGPDTTEVTGWKGGKSKGGREGKELPKYHDQYFRFRGYVFFNSDDSSLLPWTTSKTGIDKDSPEYSFTKAQMILMAKTVKPLMDEMKKEREKDNPESEQLLNLKVEEASRKSIKEVSTVLLSKNSLPVTYVYPKNLFNPPNKGDTRISFKKPSREVKKVMEYYSVTNPNDAGSSAFDYFYKNQIGKT
jgi:hypothetical protein